MRFEVKQLFNNGSRYNYLFINPESNINEETMKYLYFNIKTYSKLSRTDLMLDKLNPIPNFINKLSKTEQSKLIKMFIDVKKCILFDETKSIEKIASNIGTVIFDVFENMNLVDKLKKYVIDNKVPIPNLKNIGTRPQDNKKTTFYYEEYLDLTTITLICKLLCGIFGEIIFLVSNINSSIDNSLKEIYAIFVIKKILDKYFKNLIDKLVYYIENFINKVKSGQDLNSLFKGYDKSKIRLSVYSIIIIKKFVNIDLYDPGQNIMIYIYRCISKTLESLAGSLKKKNIIMERYSSSSIFSDGDNDEEELLEEESFSFNITLDVPILIRYAADQIIEKYEKQFDPTLFKQVSNYYLFSILDITPINELLVATFLSSEIESAYSIKQLKIFQFVKLITIIQLQFLKNRKYKNLINLLSLTPSTNPKEFMSEIDNRIYLNKGIGTSFRLIKSNLQHLSKEIEWNVQINKIVNFIIRYNHFYNTCPQIYELMSMPNKNGDIIEYEEDIIHLIYDYIAELLFI